MLTYFVSASGLIYQPTASTTSNHSYSSAHLSPPPVNTISNGSVTPDSESDLSEAIDIPAAPISVSNNEQGGLAEDGRLLESDIPTSQDEDALGSDDPDYNRATPPEGIDAYGRDARSSSQDSPAQQKRKAGIEPDDFIRHDPELYGLRRSVSQ